MIAPLTTVRSSILGRVMRAIGLGRRNRGGPSERSGHAASTGAWGEREAERALRAKGYAIVGRNMVTRAGEADLVCRAPDGKSMVIVEVKSRVVGEAGSVFRPERSVNRAKRRRLVGIARLLARANRWRDREVRVDVVAVERIGERLEVRHHEGIARFRV
mgnify:CR=1 FL=1